LATKLLTSVVERSGQKLITKQVLQQHGAVVGETVKRVGEGDREIVEKTLVKLGVQIEVTKEREVVGSDQEGIDLNEVSSEKNLSSSAQKSVGPVEGMDYEIKMAPTLPDRKLEVKDFTRHFRGRYQQMQQLLMGRPELQSSLVSIGKLSGERQSVSVIGIVREKRVTKNKNLILKVEDLTGEVLVLAKPDREEVFAVADEAQLDDVIGIRGSGNQEMLFAHELFFPDSFLQEKTRFENETCVAFISDVHCGSNNHLGAEMERMVSWLGSDDETAKKIQYLFVVGDTVDGVGVFPGQEDVLDLMTMEEQYGQLAGYLKQVPKRVTIFLCAGQHDACRVAEPQPPVDEKYAAALYGIENVKLVTNPCYVNLIEGEKKFKILMYHGASIHSFIGEIKELRQMKAHQTPAKAVCHMLKRRHLAPVHGSAVYIPQGDVDPMMISEVPDVLCTGEVHRLDVETYHGTLIITGSCWQSQTPFEEKVGNVPDPCKVPVLNLKTGALKVFDFSSEGEEK
jgi:DNA polymerase II small subunit